MKKLFCIFILFFGLFFFQESFATGCDYTWDGDVGNALANCIQGSDVVYSGWEFTVEWNFKSKINTWTRTLASVLALLAVGAIVYWAFLMTLSWWEDERIKKGKDIVKWSIFWFLGVVAAGGLISILVNFIFAIG